MIVQIRDAIIIGTLSALTWMCVTNPVFVLPSVGGSYLRPNALTHIIIGIISAFIYGADMGANVRMAYFVSLSAVAAADIIGRALHRGDTEGGDRHATRRHAIRDELSIQRRKLAILEQERAHFSEGEVPPHILLDIQDTRRRIQELAQELADMDGLEGGKSKT